MNFLSQRNRVGKTNTVRDAEFLPELTLECRIHPTDALGKRKIILTFVPVIKTVSDDEQERTLPLDRGDFH